MDDLDDIKESEFVTDTDDQDSLDEKIDSEQRIRNQELWASFQDAACCITKLYKDRTQPNVSPWIPFQHAASNLTTLYKNCIESQRRFAKIGYQVGRRKRLKEFKKLLKRHHLQTKSNNGQSDGDTNAINDISSESSQFASTNLLQPLQRRNTVSSILAVNKLNLDCEEMSSHQMEEKNKPEQEYHHSQQFHIINEQHQQHTTGFIAPQHNNIIHNSNNTDSCINTLNSYHNNQNTSQNPIMPSLIANNEEDLVTFQQALVQPAAIKSVKLGHNTRRPSMNTTVPAGFMTNRSSIDVTKSEEDRLLELNQFLSEEYHRHVGSRKRSCASIGGNVIKRARE